jgi:hypothetical protein
MISNHHWSCSMCRLVTRVSLLVVAAMLAVNFGHAETAADRYPYCAVDNGSGATNCYFASRAQCGSNCIANPGYVDRAQARAYPRTRRLSAPR